MCVYTEYINQIWHPMRQTKLKENEKNAIYDWKKITLRLGTSKRETENSIILLPCLFQCFATATKTATTTVLKMQYMPQMFSQWLFTGRVKLYCRVARFITSACYPQNKLYLPRRSSTVAYQSLLKKNGLSKQVESPAAKHHLLTNYPFHTH